MRMSLKTRICFIMVLVAVLVTIAICVVYVMEQNNKLREFERSYLLETLQDAKTLSYVVTPYLIADNYVFMNKLVSHDKTHSYCDYVLIVNNENKIMAHSNREYIGSIFTIPSLLRTDNMDGGLVRRYSRAGKNYIDISYPVKAGDLFLGSVSIGLTADWLQAMITKTNRTIYKFLLTALAAISLGILIAYALSEKIARPILLLRDTAERIGKGDYEQKVSIERHDEVGMLADSFNKMMMDLKNARNQLVEKDYVNSIIANMTDALIVIETDGIVKTVNKSALNLLGYTEEELVGQSFEKFFGEESLLRNSVEDLLIEERVATRAETTFKAKDGKVIPVRFAASVMYDDNRDIQGIVCLAQDITEHKKAEEKLKKTYAELERSNSELRQFVYIASHDLQEPLRKVIIFGNLLESKYAGLLGSQGKDYLQRMQDSSGRMQILINDLLTFSRVATKARPYTTVNLSAVVQEVFTDFDVLIGMTGAQTELNDLPAVEADPLQMKQLFQNLIGNALKFHKEGEPPVVKVYGQSHCPAYRDSAASSNGYRRITVEDNGIGLDEKYADRIFGVFQRLHGRSEYDGTGIGLSVCKKIVERHKGTIEVKSRSGEGAKFTVTLPVKQQIQTSQNQL